MTFFTYTFSMYSRSVSIYHITWRRREFLYLDSSYCPPRFPLFPLLLHYLHLLHTKSRSDCCGMKQIVWSWVCNKNDIRSKDLIFVSSVCISSSSSHIPASPPPTSWASCSQSALIDRQQTRAPPLYLGMKKLQMMMTLRMMMMMTLRMRMRMTRAGRISATDPPAQCHCRRSCRRRIFFLN